MHSGHFFTDGGLKGWILCIAVVLRLKTLHERRFEGG